MGGTRSSHEGGEKCVDISEKPEGKKPPGRPRRR
jgi:hypothetical protein